MLFLNIGLGTGQSFTDDWKKFSNAEWTVKCYPDSEAIKLKLSMQGKVFFYKNTDSIHNYFWYAVRLPDPAYDSASLATIGMIWNCIPMGPKNFEIENYYYFADPCWSDYHSETNNGNSFEESLKIFMAQNFPNSSYIHLEYGGYRKINGTNPWLKIK